MKRGKHVYRVYLRSGQVFEILADSLVVKYAADGTLTNFSLSGAVEGFPEFLKLSDVSAITRD
ncbi:hypothetical protein [Streptomyces sp. NPDC057748]|uniref:hypothetical protein n=1 Tax=unclassified Streptomyces TaxID=2593676 RepID=UPI0036A4CFCF